MSVAELKRLLDKMDGPRCHDLQLPYLLSKLNELKKEAEAEKDVVVISDPAGSHGNRNSASGESTSPDTTIRDAISTEIQRQDVDSRTANRNGAKSEPPNLEKRPLDDETPFLVSPANRSTPLKKEIGETGRNGRREWPSDGGRLAGAPPLGEKLLDLLELTRRPLLGDRVTLVEQVTDIVVSAHMETCIYTKETVAAGRTRFYESLQAKESVEKLSPDAVWSRFVENMAPVIRRVVVFSKSLPGFAELTQDDQIKLIKQGSFEVILARYTPLFTDHGMFLPDMTACVPLEIIHKMPLGDFFMEQFEFAKAFNQLQLSDGEIGLLTAIMIINPDRNAISNRRAVQKLQLLMSQSLYLLLKRNHPDSYDNLFLSLLKVLPWSSSINEIHAQKLNSVRVTSAALYFPQLHLEVYDHHRD